MPDPISKRSRSFFASSRLRVIGAILSAAAVLFLLALIAGRNDEAPSIQEQAAREEAVVKRVEAPAPTEDSGPEDEVPLREDAAPSAAERPPDEPEDERGGRGRIYGSVAMPGGVPIPSDMRVTLHRFDSESLEVSYEDTLLETAAPGPDGAFDFKDLPLTSYALFATNAGHTIHSTATLSRARTERNLTLRVVPGGAITGRVLNETGEAVAGAHVFTAAWNMGGQTRNAPRSRALASRVTTDEDGAFVMRNLRIGAPGEHGYRLAVKSEGYAT